MTKSAPPALPSASSEDHRRGCMVKVMIAMCVVMFLPVILGLAIWVESIRADHAWDKVTAELAAEGETLMLNDILLPEPPDEENYAATPLINSIQDFSIIDGETAYNDEANHDRFLTLAIPEVEDEKPPSLGDWRLARFIAPAEWLTHYEMADGYEINKDTEDASALLLALSRFDPEWQELVGALDLPKARLKRSDQPMDTFIEGMSYRLPGFNELTDLSKLLSLRASVALLAGDTNTARESLAIGLRNTTAISKHHSLIPSLVEITQLQILLQPIWLGLETSTWTDEDLKWLDQELAKPDLLASMTYGLRCELAMLGGKFNNTFGEFFWMKQNAALMAKLIYRDAVAPVKNRDIKAICLATTQAAPEFKKRTPYNIVARIAVPVYSGISKRAVATEIHLDLARIACRLELHQRQTGSYPTSLTELPEDTPVDLITNKPYQYALTSDGRYKLWSVGTDLFDDHGFVGLKENTDEPKIDRDTGDLVWAYRPEDLLPPE